MLGLPMALWGLVGIIVPLVVWLLSKRKQDVVEFGSVRFLEEVKSPSARSIDPSQWLLFALRAIVIGLMIVMIAKPLFPCKTSKEVVYIEKGVYDDPAFQTVLSKLQATPEIIEPSSLSLLILKLNASGERATVYTRNLLKDFSSIPVGLSSAVEWRVVPFSSGLSISDTSSIADRDLLASIHSDEGGITWQMEGAVKIASKKLTKVKLLSSTSRKREAANLLRILKAYSKVLPIEVVEVDEGYEWLISIDTISSDQSKKGINWSSFKGGLNVEQLIPGSYNIVGSVDDTDLSSSTFSLDLAHLILAGQMKLRNLDRRVEEIPGLMDDAGGYSQKREERKGYWAVVILIVLVIERWVSRKFARA